MIGVRERLFQHTGIGTYVQGLLTGWAKTGLRDELDLVVYGNGKHPFRSRIYSIEEQIEYPWRLKEA